MSANFNHFPSSSACQIARILCVCDQTTCTSSWGFSKSATLFYKGTLLHCITKCFWMLPHTDDTEHWEIQSNCVFRIKCNISHSFIHSLNKYIVNTCCVPDTAAHIVRILLCNLAASNT